MSLFGREWKKVENHIGTRSGAQIRSHAQKFFNRIEKELGADVEAYIQQKAQAIFSRKKNNLSNNTVGGQENYLDDDLDNNPDFYHDTTIPIGFTTPRKTSLTLDHQVALIRDRSISHTFGVAEFHGQSGGHLQNETGLRDQKFQHNLSVVDNNEASSQQPNKISKSKQGKKKREIYAFSPTLNPLGPQNAIENNILQQVIRETITNYEQVPENDAIQKNTKKDPIEVRLLALEKDRNSAYENLLAEFNESLSQP